MSTKFYGDITHLAIERHYYRSGRESIGFIELQVYFVPRHSHSFEFVCATSGTCYHRFGCSAGNRVRGFC